MPKIKDLAISASALDRLAERGPVAGKYWMCHHHAEHGTVMAPPEDVEPPPECHPTRKPCHPSDPPPDDPRDDKGPDKKKNTRALPAHAIMELRQQLQHHINNHPHA